MFWPVRFDKVKGPEDISIAPQESVKCPNTNKFRKILPDLVNYISFEETTVFFFQHQEIRKERSAFKVRQTFMNHF